MVEEGDQGSATLLQGQCRGVIRRQEFHLCTAAIGVETRSPRRLCALHVKRNDRWRRIPLGACHRRRAAGRRHVVAYLVTADEGLEIRFDLRWRTKKC